MNFTHTSHGEPCVYLDALNAKETFNFAITPSLCSWKNWTSPYNVRIVERSNVSYCEAQEPVECKTPLLATGRPDKERMQTCTAYYYCESGSRDCTEDQTHITAGFCFAVTKSSNSTYSADTCKTITDCRLRCENEEEFPNCSSHHCACT